MKRGFSMVKKTQSRGFTLIASLLVLALLSALAVGLMFMVYGNIQIGGHDLESNLAYYGAESGMEKLTVDLAALFQTYQSPTPTQLTSLTNNPPDPTMVGSMSYLENITWTPDANGNPKSTTSVISSGAEAGLSAEIVPLTLLVTATRPGGASVKMTRGVEVALIPVFQFGVFSDSDLSYFPGPAFDFQGRVHTNGNLFLATGTGPLVLDAKVTAVNQIIRDRLANGFLTAGAYGGDVYVPNANGGCDPPNTITDPNCLKFTVPDASWNGGIPPAGNANGLWTNVSTVTFNGMIGNGASLGVTPLQLPFVQGNAAQQIQIIRRRPNAAESVTSPLGASREYNKAAIRILLADTLADLHPDRGPGKLDGQDVQLEALQSVTSVSGTPAGSISYFAVADPSANTNDPNLITPTCDPAAQGPNCRGANPTWPLVKGWLRVEYLNNAGAWVGVTNEWLQLGFARTLAARTAPGVDIAGHPNAILIFQQLADRNGDGVVGNGNVNPLGPPLLENSSITGFNYNFYPINFYDPREGEPRDNPQPGLASPSCQVNGIMNAVELDVGNLTKWLAGTLPASGPNVNFISGNGYVLYFSDRRGMVPDPNSGGVTSGEYGFEDVINSNSINGTPDGVLEPVGPTGFSPEDVDENNLLDAWGAANVGDGFGLPLNTTKGNPYVAVNCVNGGRQNWVSGARHVLRLVDGSLNNLPVRADNGLGGFTVASENPVYVLGNYNSNASDPFWANPATTVDIPHSAAAVIADSVTLLSSNWSDFKSMQNSLNRAGRGATSTYYRMAVSGGKNMNFPQPAGTAQDFGTDGGVHNFLRYIEDWSGATLSYRGSLISLYYSQYATGVYKCCNLVYNPPTRNYYFDNAFLNPSNLPPGTPMLQDVVNLSYWQDFRPN
jgi:type II secretory pathway pseudopilin PulG